MPYLSTTLKIRAILKVSIFKIFLFIVKFLKCVYFFLTKQLVRKFAYSILQCMDALYRNRIIHCDLKPENILLKQQGRSGIKVRFEQIT